MLAPICPRTRGSLKIKRGHGGGEHQTCRRHDTAGADHRADDTGLESGSDLFFESGYQQQVVDGPHRKQQDDGQCQVDPEQRNAKDVLPQQHRQAE